MEVNIQRTVTWQSSLMTQQFIPVQLGKISKQLKPISRKHLSKFLNISIPGSGKSKSMRKLNLLYLPKVVS